MGERYLHAVKSAGTNTNIFGGKLICAHKRLALIILGLEFYEVCSNEIKGYNLQ